jgi:hypothetical protein
MNFLATLAVATGINGSGLINAIIWLVVLGLIFWLIFWFIGWVGVPEPFNKVLRVVIGLIILILLINFLLGFAGHGFINF